MWSALKGAIFEADPAAAPAATGAKTVTVTAANIQPGMPSMIGSTVNPEFVEAIKKAVFSKATALTSLVAAADSLAEIIPDQTTRYKAAFKTSGNGRTVQQIAAAADIHLADVEGEELRFKAAVEAKLGGEATQLEQEARNAEQGVQQTLSHIEQLQRQLAEHQNRVIQLQQRQSEATNSAAQKRAEMQLTADQFKAAAQVVRNEIATMKSAVVASLS